MKHAEDQNGGDGVQQSQVSSSEPGPSILANNVIGPLLLEALDGFLFMVSCTGEIEFVSENVTNYLGYLQNDLITKSIYSIIHPDDQLDFSNRLAPLIERSRSATNDRPANRSISFSCRLQFKPNELAPDSGSVVRPQVPQYETLQILALLQPYPHDRDGRDIPTGNGRDSGNQYFLACIARRLNVMERMPVAHDIAQFLTKQDLKGIIMACDTSRFTTDQLSLAAFIGHSIKEFCHPNDISQLDRHHTEVLRIGTNLSGVYRMQLAPGHYVFVQTKSKLFKNSASGNPEFIMSTHSIVRKCDQDSELNGSASNSLMKALIGKSIPLSKPREKSQEQRSQQSYHSSTNGLMPSQSCTNGSGVNEFDIDRLSSVSDVGDVSEINDLLEILHRQDSADNSGSSNFDLLSTSAFCDITSVTPLMQEVLRQSSPADRDRRSSTSRSMSNSNHTSTQNTSNYQSSNGNQTSQFNGMEETDVTSLLMNLMPGQQQQQQLQHHQQHQHQTLSQRRGAIQMLQQQTQALNQSPTAPRSMASLKRRQVASTPGTSVVSPPLMPLRHSVTSPSMMLNSPLTTSSPAHPPNMMPSPASASSPWPQSSPAYSDDIKPVTLMDQIRRLKCSSGAANHGSRLRSPDAVFGRCPATPTASSNIGLKDLLLSNDDDDLSVKSDGHRSRSNSHVSDTSTAIRDFMCPSSDSAAADRKRHASASERPDSSTKPAKPNVLLMRLLSGQDDTDNEKDACNTDCSSNKKPTSSREAGDRSDCSATSTRSREGRMSGEITGNRNNNLLRQLLNEEKEERPQSPPQQPLKLLEKLMNNEVSPPITDKSSSSTLLSPIVSQQSQLIKSLTAEKTSNKEKYRPSAEDEEKLKKYVPIWDESNSSTVTPRAGMKRKASVVTETPADSTEDSIAATSGGGADRTVSSSRKQQRKDILLTRLLSTNHSTIEPVLDTQAISAIATGTPQMNLVRRPTGDFDTIGGVSVLTSGTSNGNFSSSEKDSSRLPNSLLSGSTNLQYLNQCDVESDDDLTKMLQSMSTPTETDLIAVTEETEFLSHINHLLNSPTIELSELDSLLGDGSFDVPSSSLMAKMSAATGLESDCRERTTMSDSIQISSLTRETAEQPPTKIAKRPGTGLLQQLLGGTEGNGGDRPGSRNSYNQHFSNGPMETASAGLRNDVSRSCSSTLPSSNSAEVAALIQRATIQAATNTQQASMADRRNSHSRQNNINFIQPDCTRSPVSNLSDLNDLLNVSIPPNVTAPVNARNQRMSMSSLSSSGVTTASTGRASHGMQPTNEYPRHTMMNTAIMAGGAIVQNSGIEMSAPNNSNSVSFSMSSPMFSTDVKSPLSTTSSRDMPSPFSSLNQLSTSRRLPASPAFNGSPHPATANSYLAQSSASGHTLKQEKVGVDQYSQGGMQPYCVSDGSGRMSAMQQSLSRRGTGSCSVEVMQGLRAKCSARSQSSQPRAATDQLTYNSTSSAGQTSETSELPPDILQSLSELTEEQMDCLSSVVDDSLSGRQLPSDLNGSLEELLAGLSDDMDESRGLFGPLTDTSMLDQTQLKQECANDNLNDMSSLPDQHVTTMNQSQMNLCDPAQGQQQMNQGHGWAPQQQQHHPNVDSRLSNTRGTHQQQQQHQFQQPQQNQMMQARYDQQTMQYSHSAMSNIQGMMGSNANPGMMPSQTAMPKQSAGVAAQYRHHQGNMSSQMHAGMMQQQQQMPQGVPGRLMHAQSSAMMPQPAQHRSSSHRLGSNQQTAAMMPSSGPMMSAECGGMMPGSPYMNPMQSNQRGGMMMQHQQDVMRDHGAMINESRGMNMPGHGQQTLTHKMPGHSGVMHGNAELGAMHNEQSRMMPGHSTAMHGNSRSMQRQSMMMQHGQPSMIHGQQTMSQNQFNQSALMGSQPAPMLSHSRLMQQQQGQTSSMQSNPMAMSRHHQSNMLPYSQSQGHSDMMMPTMKNQSLRGQSDMMMMGQSQSRITHQSSTTMMKGYSGMMPNQMDMMQSGQMTAIPQQQQHMPKHQRRETPGVQQGLQDAQDLDMFNWLSSEHGQMSPDLLSMADTQSAPVSTQVSPPKSTPGNFQSSYGSEHFPGSQDGPGIDPSLPVGSSSLDFLTNPTSFLSRVHEDGFSSRQQMLQIAMAPDNAESKASRQANGVMYRRQTSAIPSGTSPLAHVGGPAVCSAGPGGPMSGAGRFQSGLSRDNMSMTRSPMSMHGRAGNDVTLDAGLTHPELSSRRLTNNNSMAMPNQTAGSYQGASELGSSGNDSLMNQLFGTPATPMSVAGPSDAAGSRSHQTLDASSIDSDVSATNSASAAGTGVDERKSLDGRHGSNGSLLQQLLSD